MVNTLELVPSLRDSFLSSFGSCIHAASVRVLFRHLAIQDDGRLFNDPDQFRRSVTYPLFSSPKRYALAVKTLTISGYPDVSAKNTEDPNGPLSRTRSRDDNAEGYQTFYPISNSTLGQLLEVCCNIEELVWQSIFPPPDGLCEVCVYLRIH